MHTHIIHESAKRSHSGLLPAITLAPTDMPDDGDGTSADVGNNAPSASFVWGAMAMSIALLLAGVWLQG